MPSRMGREAGHVDGDEVVEVGDAAAGCGAAACRDEGGLVGAGPRLGGRGWRRRRGYLSARRSGPYQEGMVTTNFAIAFSKSSSYDPPVCGRSDAIPVNQLRIWKWFLMSDEIGFYEH